MAVSFTYLAIVSTYVPYILESFDEASAIAKEGAQSEMDRASEPSYAQGDAEGDTEFAATGEEVEAMDRVASQQRDSEGSQNAASAIALAAIVLLIAMAAPFLAGFENIIGLLIIGFASGSFHDAPSAVLIHKNASMVGVYVGAYSKPFTSAVHEAVLELWRDKKIRAIVGSRVGFDQAAAALEELAQRRAVGKTVVCAS